MLTIGFTGTRVGMTILQRNKVTEYLRSWVADTDDLIVARHGNCTGSDEEFVEICSQMNSTKTPTMALHNTMIAIVSHPPVKADFLSSKAERLSHCVKRPKGYLTRDRAIVDDSDLVLATPLLHEDQIGPNLQRAGGTWYTIKYARHRNVPVYIIYRDGSVKGPT